MNLREYLVALILLLAIAIGGYHYLGRLLVTTVEQSKIEARHRY